MNFADPLGSAVSLAVYLAVCCAVLARGDRSRAGIRMAEKNKISSILFSLSISFEYARS